MSLKSELCLIGWSPWGAHSSTAFCPSRTLSTVLAPLNSAPTGLMKYNCVLFPLTKEIHYGWNWLKFKQKLPPAIFHKNVPKMMILTQLDIYLEVFSWFQLISADFDCFSSNSEVLTNFAYNPSTKLMFSPVTSVSVMKISWYQPILDKICALTAFDSF